ncbi:hypothetical protein A6R71_16735 [Xanthomonas translucens pv. arrhenatheri]|uniref:Uncharacterized protein n=1 Tax=Xanthomonas graminis pv. arrhenatheri LMG 727 TaxID=1195923 RepID=A0A0K2ZCV9_9XANT|nr:hypothetical protein [Xanthomonas translucens]OAX67019.1 hypothetical protein A6R71_16735 [Xanthomonas translucens pv. arrhenatheri]UKE78216.1 hypothetical protein KM317_02920 [Xanthomonas translucens pv. arrhenatheri]CTP83251.1 hypothetical protein XTALMG727_0568 [Xanthomonas translucens pv. arrhenatheri LMG 727]
MQSTISPVPYAERCHRLPPPGTTAIVWPFLNVEKGNGPYELFLDTNALVRKAWVRELPPDIRQRAVLNPWLYLLEQWLSNPEFRKDPQPRIDTMVEELTDLGFAFRDQFAVQQVAMLQRNDAALRTQFSLIFPYVAIMKSLMSQKISAEAALAKLDEILRADIPRLTALTMLLALSLLLKRQQAFKLDGDTKPAYSYLASFLDFHTEKKDEVDHINVPYLRNRAGDLSLWLSLPSLRQSGYEFTGNPALVTDDKALHRVILRVLPPLLTESRAMGFSLDANGLDAAICQRILDVVKPVVVRGPVRPEERELRMFRLFNLARELCTQSQERAVLEDAWQEWCLPGLHQQIII